MAESNMCLDGDLENHLSSRTIIGDAVIYSSDYKETNFSLNKQGSSHNMSVGVMSNNVNLQLTCFTKEARGATLHFQIINLPKQIYLWIGCNSAKLGHLYAEIFQGASILSTRNCGLKRKFNHKETLRQERIWIVHRIEFFILSLTSTADICI